MESAAFTITHALFIGVCPPTPHPTHPPHTHSHPPPTDSSSEWITCLSHRSPSGSHQRRSAPTSGGFLMWILPVCKPSRGLDMQMGMIDLLRPWNSAPAEGSGGRRRPRDEQAVLQCSRGDQQPLLGSVQLSASSFTYHLDVRACARAHAFQD